MLFKHEKLYLKVYVVIVVMLLTASFVAATSFQIKTSNDNLEINEELGNVIGAITSSHVPELKSASAKTKEGTTSYSQYLRFKNATNAIAGPKVLLDKSDADEVAEFLKITKGSAVTDAFFEYHIQFSEGLKSKVKDKLLTGLDGTKIYIFDEEYLIVEGTVDGSKINLVLASGAINDYLGVGEKKEYTIGSNKYEISIKTIETAAKAVILTINGQDIKKLVKTETQDIGNGLTLGITDVLISGGGNDLVQFYIGANLLELEDTTYSDNSFNKGVKKNKQVISDAFVLIAATLVNDVLKISDIKYRAVVTADIHAKTGESIIKYISDPKILWGNWDLKFGGFTGPGQSQILFTPSGGDDEYTLSFTNAAAQKISVPFISNKATFKFGDDDQDLVFIEGTNQTNYIINTNDYFVLTSSNAKTGSTYILKYDSINTGSQQLQFTDLGGGTKTFTYTNATTGILGDATLIVGSINAKIYIENAAGNNLAIDMNGDGDVNADEMNIVVEGGGLLDLGTSNTPAGTTNVVSVTTASSKMEEASADETVTFTFDTTLGTKIGISSTFTGVTTKTSSANHVLGLTNYGARFDLNDLQGKSEILTIDYPNAQMFVVMSLEASPSGSSVQTAVKDIKVTTCSNGLQDGDETAVDCGGSCPACATCTDSVRNQNEAGVDCGGPCEKKCEIKVDPNACTDGCLQILENGKKRCLQKGEVVKKQYCAQDLSLKAQKRNGQVCVENYECVSSKCIDGTCGRKITTAQVVSSSIILILIIGILRYGFSLLKKNQAESL
ncbi:MAG: hypothetical protein AABW64_01155 [Nanoarchaeota archaeon]